MCKPFEYYSKFLKIHKDIKLLNIIGKIMKKITVDANSINQRLDNFLLKKFKNTPKTLLYKLIRKGKFKVNKKNSPMTIS